MELSFGMLFSIILIIIFIAFAIYGVSKFLSLQKGIQTKTFANDLNFDIDIVGRDKEIQMIDELYHKKENFSQILYIYGKSGLGKSKLCKSFLQKNKEENHQQFYYSCSEASKNIPYSAFQCSILSCKRSSKWSPASSIYLALHSCFRRHAFCNPKRGNSSPGFILGYSIKHTLPFTCPGLFL